MNGFFRWFSALRGPRVDAAVAPVDANGHADFLTRARAFAADGRLSDASSAYARIKRKHQTAESLVEHSEVLLRIGDYFGATSRAAQALVLDPSNLRAKAVQAHVRDAEEKESRSRRRGP